MSLSVASSVDSQRLTGGFSLLLLTTMPSDSDRNLTLDFCWYSFSSVSEISDILGLEMGLTMSRVSRLAATLFLVASFLSMGGGGETEESELTLTKVELGDSSRFLSSFNTSGRLSFFEEDTSETEGLPLLPTGVLDLEGFLAVPLVVLFLPAQLPMTRSLVEDLVLTRGLAEVTRSLVDVLVVPREDVTVLDTLGLGSLIDDLFTRSLLTRPLVTRRLVGRVIGLD